MFVPVPKQNFRVFVKDEQHDWRDVFSELVNAHQHNRFGGHENTFLSMSSALRYYAASSGNSSYIKTSSNGYTTDLLVLYKVIMGYLTFQYNQRPKNMELIITITSTDTGKTYAHYYRN